MNCDRGVASLLRMSAVWQRFPDMILAPAHDARGFAELPVLAKQHDING